MVVTSVRVLHFTRLYKDPHLKCDWWFWCQCVANLLGDVHTNNYWNKERFDNVIAKIKWCSLFASQCTCVFGRESSRWRWDYIGNSHGSHGIPMGIRIARLAYWEWEWEWNGWMGMGGNENSTLSRLPLKGSWPSGAINWPFFLHSNLSYRLQSAMLDFTLRVHESLLALTLHV